MSESSLPLLWNRASSPIGQLHAVNKALGLRSMFFIPTDTYSLTAVNTTFLSLGAVRVLRTLVLQLLETLSHHGTGWADSLAIGI